jgi:nucleoside-diphosphate-sugar epimerase
VKRGIIGRYGTSDYGKSKLAGEELFFDYGKEIGAKIAVCRFPNLMGHSRLNYNSAVSTFCNAVANDLPWSNREKEKVKMRQLTKKIFLITGAAGFIGSNLVLELLRTQSPVNIIGLDNMNDYYDVSIKEWRLTEIQKCADEHSDSTWTFIKGSIADKAQIDSIFNDYKPDVVVNLAAQAGVRYSISNPDVYIESNLIGFYNILEACRHSYDGGAKGVEHLVYASSSSVYGSNKKVPYSTEDKVDNPVSLYAATKKSNELLAHAYSKLYNIPSTGLRFFTVYGPAGRPDMAYFGFTNKLLKGETIQIFNYGNCKRDFTYVDDIVEGVIRVMQAPPERKNGEDGLPIPPYAVYNIGNNQPENLLDFVDVLQQELIRAGVLPEDYDFEAHKELVPMQPGDVPVTYADTSALERDFGFKPSTSLRDGLRKFAEWYKEFYKI